MDGAAQWSLNYSSSVAAALILVRKVKRSNDKVRPSSGFVYRAEAETAAEHRFKVYIRIDRDGGWAWAVKGRISTILAGSDSDSTAHVRVNSG